MPARLCYMGLEMKRAWKRFPQLAAGAAAFLFLIGAAALLAGRALYGGQVTGRIAVGVVLPEGGPGGQAGSLYDLLHGKREKSL